MRDVAKFNAHEPDRRIQELETHYANNPEYLLIDYWDDVRTYIHRSYLDDWKNRIVEEMALERIREIVRLREECDRGEPHLRSRGEPFEVNHP